MRPQHIVLSRDANHSKLVLLPNHLFSPKRGSQKGGSQKGGSKKRRNFFFCFPLRFLSYSTAETQYRERSGLGMERGGDLKTKERRKRKRKRHRKVKRKQADLWPLDNEEENQGPTLNHWKKASWFGEKFSMKKNCHCKPEKSKCLFYSVLSITEFCPGSTF
jgi:hypothetical protein